MDTRILRYGFIAAVAAATTIPLSACNAQTTENAHQPTVQPATEPAATTQPATEEAPTTAAVNVDPDAVVLSIGAEKITAGEFDTFIADLPAQYQQMAQGPGKRLLAEELIKIKLLAAEAKRRKLDETPKIQRQMQIMTDQVLASAIAADVVSDEDVRKYMEENPTEFDKVKARHILIRIPGSAVPLKSGDKELTEEEAKAKADDIRKRLEAGEDFAKIATAESADQGSGAQGGDLGTFGRGDMVPEFDKAAFSLKKGEISQPVKSQFGYHIIQVEDIIKPSSDDVKQALSQRMGPQRTQELINKLREEQTVELNRNYFGEPPPTQPSPLIGPPSTAPADAQ